MMSNYLENSKAKNPSTSHITSLPFELIAAILDYLDATTLQRTIRTAKFLRYSSEQRLFRRVIFPIDSNSWDAQACFLETIAENDRLGHHVVKLVLGRSYPFNTGGALINHSIGQAMKKLVNLKELDVYGSPAIINAHLDSVPFSLTHLVLYVSWEKTTYTGSDFPLLSVLQAHPTLEELALRVSELPRDLVSTLKAEQDGLTSENDILCPKLKRFKGTDEGMRLLLPMRKIESRSTLAPGPGYIADEDLEDVWLTPALIQSYKHLRVLEVYPDRRGNTCFLSIITPYLTSLIHLHLFDNLHYYGPTDHILLSLGKLPALKSVTFTDAVKMWTPGSLAREIAQTVRTVCPDIREIFVQESGKKGEDPNDTMYYRHGKRKGIDSNFVSHQIARKPYGDWLHE